MTGAEQEVLRICRSRALPGIPCLRELHERNPHAAKGRCVVVDNARWDSPILFQGFSWTDVLTAMRSARVAP